LRQKCALGLRQINQILRHPFLAQDPLHHFTVASRAPEAGFHDGAAPRRLEIVHVGQDGIVHRQRQIVRNRTDFPFRASAQIRIHIFGFRNRNFGDFIDGRRRRLLCKDPIGVAVRLEAIRIHGLNNVSIQFAKTRIRVDVKSAGHQLVKRLIEFLAGVI